MSVLKVMDAVGGIRHMKMIGAGTEADPFESVHASDAEGDQKPIFYFDADTNFDGSGTTNMAVDGSVTPVDFGMKPAPGWIIRVARMTWYIEDVGSFDATLWGNGIVMANGISIVTIRDGVESENVGDIKSTGDLAGFCFDVNVQTWGSGPEVCVARWTFTKAGQFVRLDGDNDDGVVIRINDDLTGLNKQRVNLQGYIEKLGS